MASKKGPSARKPARAKAKSSPRPRASTARVSASIEKDLLDAVEQFARARRSTVAQLIEQGLRKVVGAERVPVLPPGDMQSMPAPDSGPWGQLLAWMEEQQTTLTEIRNALGDVAASLPNDGPGSGPRPATGTRIPPP